MCDQNLGDNRENKNSGILGKKLIVVTIGISTFDDDLRQQGVKVLKVDWKPPAEGDEEMLKLLDKLGF